MSGEPRSYVTPEGSSGVTLSPRLAEDLRFHLLFPDVTIIGEWSLVMVLDGLDRVHARLVEDRCQSDGPAGPALEPRQQGLGIVGIEVGDPSEPFHELVVGGLLLRGQANLWSGNGLHGHG